jgi:hypothetical protein
MYDWDPDMSGLGRDDSRGSHNTFASTLGRNVNITTDCQGYAYTLVRMLQSHVKVACGTAAILKAEALNSYCSFRDRGRAGRDP